MFIAQLPMLYRNPCFYFFIRLSTPFRVAVDLPIFFFQAIDRPASFTPEKEDANPAVERPKRRAPLRVNEKRNGLFSKLVRHEAAGNVLEKYR